MCMFWREDFCREGTQWLSTNIFFVFFSCGGISSTVTEPIHKGDLCLQFWTILTILDNFDNFCQFLTNLTICDNIWNLWQFLPILNVGEIFSLTIVTLSFYNFYKWLQWQIYIFFWQCLNILKWVYNFYNVDNFL